MIKLDKCVENNDGRKDIILAFENVEQLVIRQEFYESYGVTYEEMQTDKDLAAFLVFIGLQIAKGIEK